MVGSDAVTILPETIAAAGRNLTKIIFFGFNWSDLHKIFCLFTFSLILHSVTFLAGATVISGN